MLKLNIFVNFRVSLIKTLEVNIEVKLSMLDYFNFPKEIVTDVSSILRLLAIGVIAIVAILGIRKLPKLIGKIVSTEIPEAYKIIISSNKFSKRYLLLNFKC
ncbi:MAG: hypothetical protein F6K40_18060 [Okeania sp. SIO3I5]|uniref:hypothetical protein n=1 Tax=Okeania sp. SIO3I5 TaxID=2607805 RepID=UPI0013B8AFA7|nr:hypothetical protein [Okeania sp. SIO3I5]NEQ38062.1 hypothetical protein [Okeania sp. SIO3I5]